MPLMRRPETWNPFREMEDLSNRMSRLFGWNRAGDLGQRETLATTDWAPACDISETEKEYRIHVELPHVKKDDVHVTLEEGTLTIQGERREQKEEKGVKFHRREMFFGKFMRQFSMPDDADESKVDASFDDGILVITIKKSSPKASKAKEISVH